MTTYNGDVARRCAGPTEGPLAPMRDTEPDQEPEYREKDRCAVCGLRVHPTIHTATKWTHWNQNAENDHAARVSAS